MKGNYQKRIVNREKLLNEELKKYYNPDSEYDYCVLFSGGKDSTYLAYKMKDMIGGRVCLLTVDNGLEDENFLPHVKKVAKSLELPHFIISTKKGEIEGLFNFVIKEEKLRGVDSNCVCYYCGQFIMKTGIRFAEEHNIPVVIHGMSPTQYNMPQNLLSDKVNDQFFKRNLKLLEAYRRKNLREVYSIAQNLEKYKIDKEMRKIMDDVFYESDKVKMIIPFHYLKYDVVEIKKYIKDKLNWTNLFDIPDELYISSGCRMFEILLLMENKIPGFRIHERREFEKDMQDGIVNKEAYDYAIQTAENVSGQTQITDSMMELIQRIGIEEELLK